MANEEITKPLVLSPPPSLHEEDDDRERTTDESNDCTYSCFIIAMIKKI